MTAKFVRHSLFRRVSIVLAVLYLGGSIIGGIGLGKMAMHPGRRPITEKERAQIESHLKALNANLRDVIISASDGALLRGWFVRRIGKR